MTDEECEEVARILTKSYVCLMSDLGTTFGIEFEDLDQIVITKANHGGFMEIRFSEKPYLDDDYFVIGETPATFNGTQSLTPSDIDFLMEVIPTNQKLKIPLKKEQVESIQAIAEFLYL